MERDYDCARMYKSMKRYDRRFNYVLIQLSRDCAGIGELTFCVSDSRYDHEDKIENHCRREVSFPWTNDIVHLDECRKEH